MKSVYFHEGKILIYWWHTILFLFAHKVLKHPNKFLEPHKWSLHKYSKTPILRYCKDHLKREWHQGRQKIQNFKITHTENMWLAYNKKLQQGIWNMDYWTFLQYRSKTRQIYAWFQAPRLGDKICALLGNYARYSGNSSLTFQDNLRPRGCPETSVTNYHHILCNFAEWRESQGTCMYVIINLLVVLSHVKSHKTQC